MNEMNLHLENCEETRIFAWINYIFSTDIDVFILSPVTKNNSTQNKRTTDLNKCTLTQMIRTRSGHTIESPDSQSNTLPSTTLLLNIYLFQTLMDRMLPYWIPIIYFIYMAVIYTAEISLVLLFFILLCTSCT